VVGVIAERQLAVVEFDDRLYGGDSLVVFETKILISG